MEIVAHVLLRRTPACRVLAPIRVTLRSTQNDWHTFQTCGERLSSRIAESYRRITDGSGESEYHPQARRHIV